MLFTKRSFLKTMLGVLPFVTLGRAAWAEVSSVPVTTKSLNKEGNMAFTLPDLPYAQNALEPYITANTLSFHHGKHHNAYVTNLNKLIEGTELEGKTLEGIIKAAAKDPSKAGIFNNAAQVWNHTFYWNSMKPQGGSEPTGELLAKINADFGSVDKLKEEFKNAGATQFGSGWAWLVLENGKLQVTKTGNADLPMMHGQTALLTADVWEHAYYLDFQNRRPDYLDTFLEKLANWEFAAENFKNAGAAQAA